MEGAVNVERRTGEKEIFQGEIDWLEIMSRRGRRK